jgi:glyoxylase-like metal-dependent hydrolase (beta-lactamase superfamily II)
MSTQRVSDSVYMIDAPYHGKTGVLGTYVVAAERVAVIDPGTASQAPGVIEALDQTGVEEVSTIALTHVHLDHAAGCWVLLERYPGASVHCHPRGETHVVDPSRIKTAAREAFGDKIREYGEIRGVPRERVNTSDDCERLDLGGVQLQAYHTPGHSSHSQSYYEPRCGVLFAGDAAGHTPDNLGPVIPASPAPYNPVQAADSLRRMEALDPETLCIGHFGFHGGATRWLRGFREQVQLWERIAIKGVKEGRSLTEMYLRVLESDGEAQKLVSRDPETERHVYSSLAGFVSYARWVKTRKG